MPSRFWVVGVLAFLMATGCALRKPTVSRSHEVAFGLGGVGHVTGSTDSEEEPRELAEASAVWRVSYARCLNKREGSVCFEVPVDGIPVTNFTIPNPAAPQSYSVLSITPGLRFEFADLPSGFIAIGFGAARYTSSARRRDWTTVERQRATTVSLRVDLGFTVRVQGPLGLRVGAFLVGGEEPEWFQQLGVLPAGGTLSDRFGGYGVFWVRP